MFRNIAVSFPGSLWVLVRYCGPSGGVGTAMTADLLNSNGRIVVQYTFISLTKTELNILEGKTKRDVFDVSIKEKP